MRPPDRSRRAEMFPAPGKSCVRLSRRSWTGPVDDSEATVPAYFTLCQRRLNLTAYPEPPFGVALRLTGCGEDRAEFLFCTFARMCAS